MQLPFKELPIWMVANMFELSRWAERCPSVSPVLFYLYNIGVKNLLVSKYQTRWSVLSQGPNLSTLSADDAYTSWHLTSEWQSGVSFCTWGFNCSSVRTNIIKRWLLFPAVVIYIWLLWALRASAIRTEQAVTTCMTLAKLFTRWKRNCSGLGCRVACRIARTSCRLKQFKCGPCVRFTKSVSRDESVAPSADSWE